MREAELHLDRLQLTKSQVSGRVLDLNKLFETHEATGRFRIMIFQAADRIIVKRGGSTNLAAFDIKKKREPGEK